MIRRIFIFILFFIHLFFMVPPDVHINRVYAWEQPGQADAPADQPELRKIDIRAITVLDIVTAQKIALSQRPSILAIKDRIRQARARVDQARARYWPRLDGTGTSSRVWLSDRASQMQPPGSDDPEDYFNAKLTASWLLFDGFERGHSLDAALFAEKQSVFAGYEACRQLLSFVAVSFDNALLAMEMVRISEADQAFNQRLISDAKARLSMGTGSLSDLLNFRIQANTAKTEVIQAKKDYRLAVLALAELMGLEDGAFPDHASLDPLEPDSFQNVKIPDLAAAIEYTRTHRPDILQNEFLVKQAAATIQTVKAGAYPSVSIAGSVNGERTDDPAFETGDIGHTIALTLSYNFYDGGTRKARISESRAALEETRKNLESVKAMAVSDVRKAYVRLCSAREQLNFQQSTVELVRKARDLVEKEYAAGQASLVRLNQSQRDLIQAESRLASARISLHIAWNNFQFSTGKILSPFVVLESVK